jgi:hypothetical protein
LTEAGAVLRRTDEAAKRGGNARQVVLDEALIISEERTDLLP